MELPESRLQISVPRTLWCLWLIYQQFCHLILSNIFIEHFTRRSLVLQLTLSLVSSLPKENFWSPISSVHRWILIEHKGILDSFFILRWFPFVHVRFIILSIGVLLQHSSAFTSALFVFLFYLWHVQDKSPGRTRALTSLTWNDVRTCKEGKSSPSLQVIIMQIAVEYVLDLPLKEMNRNNHVIRRKALMFKEAVPGSISNVDKTKTGLGMVSKR